MKPEAPAIYFLTESRESRVTQSRFSTFQIVSPAWLAIQAAIRFFERKDFESLEIGWTSPREPPLT